MRPDPTFCLHVLAAIQKGIRSARQNWRAMLALEFGMAVVVVVYYGWPTGAGLLSRYGAWQHAGGILYSALATAIAGGILSEVSLVYLQDRGRWTLRHLDSMGFKFAIFFVNGGIVYEFYACQTVWFGEGATWAVIVPKVLVDQFVFTLFWATPYQTLLTRWHALGYSGHRLWRELGPDFMIERMLPILLTNWMFWLPAVVFIYSMPSNLQAPLFIFGIATWGLILPAVARQESPTATGPEPVLITPGIGVDLSE